MATVQPAGEEALPTSSKRHLLLISSPHHLPSTFYLALPHPQHKCPSDQQRHSASEKAEGTGHREAGIQFHLCH